MSIVRFVLLLVYNSLSESTMSFGDYIANVVLTGVEMVLGIGQLGCWIVKKQSLPKF